MKSSHEVEQLLERLRTNWPPERSVLRQVMQQIEHLEIEPASLPAPSRQYRAALAIAATVAVLAITWWIVAPADNSLYAQVLKAIDNARTIQCSTWAIPGDDQPAQLAIQSWYERDKGFRVDMPDEVRLGHGKFFWTYRKQENVAFRFSNKNIDEAVDRELDLKRTLDELRRGGFERFAEADEIVDGKQLTAYLLTRTVRVADPAIQAGTARGIAFLDERSRIVRVRMEILQADRWIPRVLTEWQYDLPIDRALFEPAFGDNVQIVDSDAAFDHLSRLDNARYRDERRGIIFAIHRIQRFENHGVLVLSSVRATPETLEKYPLESRRIQPGLYITEGPAVNLQTSPQGNGYFRIEMAQLTAQGINLSWWVLVPRGTNPPPYEPEPGTLKLPVGFTPVGWTKFGKTFADERGVLQHTTWEAVVELPEKEEVLSTERIADAVYSDMTALRSFPFRQLFFGSKPGTNVADIRSPDSVNADEYRVGAARNINLWYERDLEFALEGQFTAQFQRQSTHGESTAIGLNYNPLVDDQTLSTIAKRTSVVRLYLNGTRISDRGLAQLAPLRELREISLNSTAITDDGLNILATLPALERVDVRGTRVTAEGIAKLRATLPNVKVEH